MVDSDAESSADNFTLRFWGHNLVYNPQIKRPPPPVEWNFFPIDQEPIIPLKATSCKPQTHVDHPTAQDVQPISPHAATGTGAADQGVVVVVEERGAAGGGGGRKKTGPRLTAVQRGRMLEYAKRVGWRVRKSDEGRMMEFCDEIGISPQRCINWLNKHRNKINIG